MYTSGFHTVSDTIECMEMTEHSDTEDQEAEGSGGRGLANQAYDALVDLILSRELKQGDQIQERILSLRLGVSRTPLREAMHRLEGERVLERKSSNRLFVRMVTLQELMETLYIRRMLESDAAARSAGKVPEAKLADLRLRIEALMKMNDPGNPLHQQLDSDLHGLITEHCGNELLASMIGDLRRMTRMFSLKRMEHRMVPVCEEHMAMIDALARGDAEAAAAETRRHIDAIRQSIMDVLSATY